MRTITSLTRENILNMSAYSSARGLNHKGILLDANENPFGDLNRYPDPTQGELVSLIASQNGVAPENVFIGNGSDEAIDLIMRIFGTPGKDSIGILTPTYGMYTVCAELNNLKIVAVPLDSSYDIDVENTLVQLKKTNMLFLCSPNNPTGNNLSENRMIKLLDAFDGITIIDEAYIQFSSQRSFISQLKNYPKLVVLQTLSKAFGLANARIGMAFASESIISFLRKVKPPYNVSGLNSNVAIQRLSSMKQVTDEIQQLISERNRLFNFLKSASFVKRIYPSDANFILVAVENAPVLLAQLAESGIIIRDRSSYVEHAVRISIGSPTENSLLLKILKTLDQ